MLNRSGNPQSNIQLGGNRLSRRSDLTIDREPLSVADWTRCSQLTAERFGQLCRQSDVVLVFDAPAHGNDYVGFTEIDRLLYLLERRFRLHANFTNIDLQRFDTCTASLHRLIRAEGARLKSRKQRRLPIGNHVCVQLAEEDATRKGNLARFDVHANAVADQSFAKTRGHLWCKIAYKICMRH